MEFVVILRVLWRYRVLMAIAAIVAVLAAAATAFRLPSLESRQDEVGVASASALVDTPSSQTVDLGDEKSASIATLAGRATLLASVMTSSPIKDAIARRAGVPSDKLITSGAGAPPAGPLGPEDISLHATVPTVESGEVPIIVVSTQAPSQELAERLANAAFDQLLQQVTSTAGIDKVPDARRLVVRRLGEANGRTVKQGPGLSMGLVVAVVVFLLGCTLIVATWALIRGWRRAAEMDAAELLGENDRFWSYDDDVSDVVPFEDRKRTQSADRERDAKGDEAVDDPVRPGAVGSS